MSLSQSKFIEPKIVKQEISMFYIVKRSMYWAPPVWARRAVAAVVMAVTLVWMMAMQGCVTTGSNVSPEAKIQSLENCQAWLEDHQAVIEQSLVIAGNIAISAVPEEDRDDNVKQMKAISRAFNAIATGQFTTVDKLDPLLTQYAPEYASKTYAPYRRAVVDAWGLVDIKLKQLFNSKIPEQQRKATELALQWALVFSRAAERVADDNTSAPE